MDGMVVRRTFLELPSDPVAAADGYLDHKPFRSRSYSEPSGACNIEDKCYSGVPDEADPVKSEDDLGGSTTVGSVAGTPPVERSGDSSDEDTQAIHSHLQAKFATLSPAPPQSLQSSGAQLEGAVLPNTVLPAPQIGAHNFVYVFSTTSPGSPVFMPLSGTYGQTVAMSQSVPASPAMLHEASPPKVPQLSLTAMVRDAKAANVEAQANRFGAVATASRDPFIARAEHHIRLPLSKNAVNRSDCNANDGTEDGEGDDRTTLMFRNLPNNYNRSAFLDMLDSEGFRIDYSFVYLPTDFKNYANFGYAFVNFASHASARKAKRHFEGFTRWTIPSAKVCEVDWSGHVQGLQAHIERYRNSSVMHESVPDEYKPLVFVRGERVDFPPPTKNIRTPRMRHADQVATLDTDPHDGSLQMRRPRAVGAAQRRPHGRRQVR